MTGRGGRRRRLAIVEMTSSVACNYGRHAAFNVEEICTLLMSNNWARARDARSIGSSVSRLSNILHSAPRVASLMHCSLACVAVPARPPVCPAQLILIASRRTMNAGSTPPTPPFKPAVQYMLPSYDQQWTDVRLSPALTQSFMQYYEAGCRIKTEFRTGKSVWLKKITT